MAAQLTDRATSAMILEAAPRPRATLARPALGRAAVAFADGVAYSSGVATAVGGALTYAVGRTFSIAHLGRWTALVVASTFLVYTVDRLRDVPRDRATSPGRTAFVERHREPLALAALIAAIAAGLLVLSSPARVVALCAAVGGLGLLHRRLKRGPRWKIAYVTAAWSAVCVGIPWLVRDGRAGAESGFFALAFVGSGVLANVIASNLRAGKARPERSDASGALRVARNLAFGGALLTAFAPPAIATLGFVPAAEAAALLCFRRSERYSHLAVDGALAVGALLAILTPG
ncbi:MAG: hypothetical protein R3F35_10115 [Myxococcota bacterium]